MSAILTAGAARAVIALTDADLPLNGFGRTHDPLCVRCLVLREGRRTTALVLVDQTSLTPVLLGGLRAIASRVTGAPQHDVLVAASHTFNAPHVLPDEATPVGERAARDHLADLIRRATATACRDAVDALRPATIGAATGRCVIAVNRDLETSEGWWHGAEPRGCRDDDVPVVHVAAVGGGTVAVLTSVAVQSSVLNDWLPADGVRPVSADLTGAVAARVEQALEGAVALVLTGAAGDQAPLFTAHRHLVDARNRPVEEDLPDAGAWTVLALLSERLAAEVLRTSGEAREPAAPGPATGGAALRVLRGEVVLPAQAIPSDIRSLRPTRSWDFAPAGTSAAPWVAVRLGPAALLGVQAELSAATGRALRAGSPFATTLVATLVDGGAKYMAEASAYDRLTYEARNSRYARGAAEDLARAAARGLEDLAPRLLPPTSQ